MRKYVFLFFLLVSASLPAQDVTLREKALFEKGLSFYKAGNYKKAEQSFALVISRLPANTYLTANYLMLAKSQYKLGDYSAALNLGEKFLNTFPRSSYKDDILYVMANSYWRFKRRATAVKTWILAMDAADNNKLFEKCAAMVRAAYINALDVSERNLLKQQNLSADGKLLLALAESDILMNKGDFKAARELISAELESAGNSSFSAEAEMILRQNRTRLSNRLRIGLLLPLSGPDGEVGQALFEGMQFAADHFNKKHDVSIELVAKDYGDDLTTALSELKKLAADPSILAVVGPVENDISTACAAVADYEKIALLSPTSTEPNVQSVSNYFFQLSTPVDVLGKNIAQYAIDSLQVNRIASLAPIDHHFIKLVDSFMDTMEEEDCQIVAEEWYYPGDQDFYKQFMKIKRKGLKLTFADSVMIAAPETTEEQLDSLYIEYKKTELEKLEETHTRIDSADIPVNSIDGLFIPVYKEDIQFIAPQIAYSNIQAQILGNQDWYDIPLLKKHKSYLNGLIFGTTGYLDEQNWDYKKFRNDYRNERNKTPDNFNMMGYDSINFLLAALGDNPRLLSRPEVFNRLSSAGRFRGVFMDILLNADHRNTRTRLLKYALNQIIPLN